MKAITALLDILVTLFLCLLVGSLILMLPVGVGWVLAKVLPFSWFQATVTAICVGGALAVVAMLDATRKELKKIALLLEAVWKSVRDAVDDEEDEGYTDDDDDDEDYADEGDDDEDYADEGDDDEDYADEGEQDFAWPPRRQAEGAKNRVGRIEARKRQRQARKRQRS